MQKYLRINPQSFVVDFLPCLVHFKPFLDRLCSLTKCTNGFENAEMPLNQLIIVCGQFPTICDPFWAITRPFVHFIKMHKRFWEWRNTSESTLNCLWSISYRLWSTLGHLGTVCAFKKIKKFVVKGVLRMKKYLWINSQSFVLDFLPFVIYFAPFWDRLCILTKCTNGFWECRNTSESILNRLCSISYHLWSTLRHFGTVCAF
jgi:hypothetical protein